MIIFLPLPENNREKTPINRIIHELDIVKIYLREYLIDAICENVVEKRKTPLNFEDWKLLNYTDTITLTQK